MNRHITFCVAVGCADLELPASSAAYVIRSDDTADVICNDSSVTSRRTHQESVEVSDRRRHHHHSRHLQSWRLVCHGTQWIGDYGNCTRHQAGVTVDDQQQQHIYSTQNVIQHDGKPTVYCTVILVTVIGFLSLFALPRCHFKRLFVLRNQFEDAY